MLIAHVNVARDYRGGERQTELLMRELDSCGITQRLVARRGGKLARRIGETGIEVRQVSGQLPGVVSATRGADLVHIHEGRSIYAGYVRHLLSNTPYIATRRVTNPIGNHGFAHRAYRTAGRVVAITPQVADVVRAFDSAVTLGVIPSSSSRLEVDTEAARAIRSGIPGGFVVGHVSALDNDQKAQDTVIAAARILEKDHPEVHFLLVGGGRDEAMLRRLAAGLGNLSFAGFVDNVGDYLAAIDLLILPSRREGMGSILLDAMEHSLPVVATNVGGVPHVVKDGANGFLIDVDSPDQLAEKIVLLKSDPGRCAALGANGRQVAAAYTPERMAAAYLELYRSVLEA